MDHWHWGMFIFGKFLENSEPTFSNFHWWGWHKSLGLIILVLVFLRLGARLASGAPPPVALPRLQMRVASAVHASLYLLLLAVPVTGWIASSATGLPVSVFNFFDVPALWREDAAIEKVMFRVHGNLATMLVVLSVLHLGAALHHHFVKGNDVLRRMLP